MLDAAGVECRTQPSAVDESGIKQAFADPRLIATELAKAKALDVSSGAGGDWVIGSDSVVSVDRRTFDKPVSIEDARAHLRFFSGKTMELTSAVALAKDGAIDWAHADTARLRVRDLSDAFIDSYLDREWPEVGYCVGVFRMEGPGIQLFESVEGDHFSILGMPLLPLIGALRDRGLIPS